MIYQPFTKRIKSVFCVVVLSAVTLIGCEKEPHQVMTNAEKQPTATASSYLTFKDYQEFDATITLLSQKKYVEVEAWEKSKGFVSLRSLFNRAVEEEAENYEREDKLMSTNPVLQITHERSNTAHLLGDMLIYNTVEGGIELNLASHRMAPVLNKDGIVKIGNRICQYTYSYNKSIRDDGDYQKAVSELKATTESSSDARIFVGKITSTRRPISVPGAHQRDFNYAYSCENASGSPQAWRVIGYINEFEGEQSVIQGNNFKISEILFTIRTLKRGFFGAWYDRSSSLQSINGTFSITGTLPYNNNWVSVIASGVRPFNAFSPTYFNISNNQGETATWQGALLRTEAEYPYSSSSIHASNIHVASGSVNTINWNSDYNCHCNINF